jgi:transcription elongation GreA/GreB family factor
VRLSPAEGLADALMDSSSYSVRRPMTFAELADAMAKLNRVGMSSADAANAMSKAMSKIGTAMASAQEGETVPVVLSPGEPEPDSSPVERPRRRFSLAK